MEIKELVIQRSMWGCRTHPAHPTSYLVRDDGKMCCLGFLGRACGVNMQRRQPMPVYIQNEWPGWTRRELLYGTLGPGERAYAELGKAAAINDDPDIAMAEKETLLIALFATVGITLRFED